MPDQVWLFDVHEDQGASAQAFVLHEAHRQTSQVAPAVHEFNLDVRRPISADPTREHRVNGAYTLVRLGAVRRHDRLTEHFTTEHHAATGLDVLRAEEARFNLIELQRFKHLLHSIHPRASERFRSPYFAQI
jgi:hypothetical protein